MSLPKFFAIVTLLVFGVIGFLAIWKKTFRPEEHPSLNITTKTISSEIAIPIEPEPNVEEEEENSESEEVAEPEEISGPQKEEESDNFKEVDRIEEFFNKRGPKFPFVETVTYKSRVSWLQGRPAWIADYAARYKTSRHFIARSLNGVAEYEKQNVSEGDNFNVFKMDSDVKFNLLVDLKSCRMWFYYLDPDSGEKVLVKTYRVSVGSPDPSSSSGFSTPVGKYSLGDKIAIFKPKMKSFHQGEKVEMVKVFGTRWIPFGKEIEGCSASPKGLGIHGLPLIQNEREEYEEDQSTLGKHISDGCIRLKTDDMEELFAIIITKPTTIEIVNGLR